MRYKNKSLQNFINEIETVAVVTPHDQLYPLERIRNYITSKIPHPHNWIKC